jgi:hypothetical protein
MLTVENTTELLSGGETVAIHKPIRVEVARAFFMENKLVGVGSVLDLPKPLARELAASGKVLEVAFDTKLKQTDRPNAPTDATPAAGEGK